MPLDLSKLDLNALTVKAGPLTSEYAAFQNAHGMAKVGMGLGILVTLASAVAAAFPGYPQVASITGLVIGLAGTLGSNLISKGAAADYQDSRNLTKTGVANAVAAVVQAHAEVAVAAQQPIAVTVQEAAPMPTPTLSTTVTIPVVPPGPAPGTATAPGDNVAIVPGSSAAPIVPSALASLILLVIMCLTGCMSDQGRQDATLNTESIYTTTEALRITLGIPQGIQDLDLTKDLTPAQKCQVYIYNIEKQAGALGGFLTVAPPNPIPAAAPATPAPSTK